MYKQEIWCCKVSGRSGMTFEEALKCEEQCNGIIKKIPSLFYLPIIHLVLESLCDLSFSLSLSTLFLSLDRLISRSSSSSSTKEKMVRMDFLVDEIATYFKSRLVIGETVKIAQKTFVSPSLLLPFPIDQPENKKETQRSNAPETRFKPP